MTDPRHQLLFDVVSQMRKRLDRARERGQVELHVNLGQLEVLIGLAEGAVKALVTVEAQRIAANGVLPKKEP